MEISKRMRQVYSEIYEFLNLLTAEQRNKIPQEIRDFFVREKDNQYIKDINPNIEIGKQDLKEETLAIIAWLNLEYWCEDENEKKRLKQVYENNEKRYQDVFQVAFNQEQIFEKYEEKAHKQEIEDTQIVGYKESFVKKIFQRVKKIFNKN